MSLICRCTCNDGNLTTITDSSGFGNNGTIIGSGTTAAAGISGLGLSFSGAGAGDFGAGALLNSTAGSISTFYNAASSQTNKALFGNLSNTASGLLFLIGFFGPFGLQWVDSGGAFHSVNGSANAPLDNTFHQAGASWGPAGVKFYKDGALDSNPFTSPVTINVGTAHTLWASGPTSSAIAAIVDEFRVWSDQVDDSVMLDAFKNPGGQAPGPPSTGNAELLPIWRRRGRR
jgi:hypothetical protein